MKANNDKVCAQVRERFLDGLSGESISHLDRCAPCARAWIEHQQILGALDSWSAPEPSPFFQTRLRARLEQIRAEEAARASGWMGWARRSWMGMPVWRPVAVAAVAVAITIGLDLAGDRPVVEAPVVVSRAQLPDRGTAVGDLQVLENHQEAISDLDLLDDLPLEDATLSPAQDQI
jgi:anti-sigma-K factor RskA